MSVRQHKAESETHKKTPQLLLLLPFLGQDYKQTKGHLYPASVPPPDTATNGLVHDISLLTSSSSHPEPLTWFGREQSALLKDLQSQWKQLCRLCGSDQTGSFLALLAYMQHSVLYQLSKKIMVIFLVKPLYDSVWSIYIRIQRLGLDGSDLWILK